MAWPRRWKMGTPKDARRLVGVLDMVDSIIECVEGTTNAMIDAVNSGEPGSMEYAEEVVAWLSRIDRQIRGIHALLRNPKSPFYALPKGLVAKLADRITNHFVDLGAAIGENWDSMSAYRKAKTQADVEYWAMFVFNAPALTGKR